jgi:hypothetical protein
MFSEILKIIPRIEGRDLNSVENSLNKRFKNVAKKFGGGLLSAIKGGGIAGLAIGLIDKVLNPLTQVQEAIEKALNSGDDLSTFAKQFNTTEGNLGRLQAFGKATGLDPEGVRLLLGKFQAAVAQAALDPSKPTAVSNFVGKADTAEAFFEFVQSMQKLNKTQQSLVQQEVFGEKQILKASEFLGANFKELSSIFDQAGAPSAAQQTQAAKWLGQLSDNKDVLAAVRVQKDLVQKSKLINDGTINGLEQKDNLDLSQENKNLGKFQSLQQISIANQKLMNVAVNAFLEIAPLLAAALPKLVQLTDTVTQSLPAVKSSRVLRGITPKGDE